MLKNTFISFFQKMSYSKQYFIIAFLSTTALILFCAALSWGLNYSLQKNANIRLEKEGHRIKKELVNQFDETKKLMVYVGKEIVKSRPEELLMIWKQLRETVSETNKYKSFMWPHFGWIDEKHQQICNTQRGVLPIPLDMSCREYLTGGFKNPWTLQFSSPALSIPDTNGALHIPIGLGITNEKGKFLGIVGSAFNIPDLSRKIDRSIRDDSIDFVVFDQRGKVILQTFGKSVNHDQIKYLPFSFKADIIGTPYTLITYLDDNALYHEYYQIILPHLIKILGGGICCLVLVYIFLQKILKKNRELEEAKKQLEQAVNLALASDAAKDKFVSRIKKELMVPFVSIVTYTDILLRHCKKEINLDLSAEKKIKFLQRMDEAANNLETLTTDILDLSYIDVKKILEDCLRIHAKHAFMKGISLQSEIPKVPDLYVDELRFKQIILGLLYRIIRFTRKGDKVYLYVAASTEDNQLFLKVILKNNGYGLIEENWRQTTHQYASTFPISRYTDGTDLELPSIERLIHLHHGKYKVESTKKKETVITLLFPYRSKEECENTEDFFKEGKSSLCFYDWNATLT